MKTWYPHSIILIVVSAFLCGFVTHNRNIAGFPFNVTKCIGWSITSIFFGIVYCNVVLI